MDLRTATTCVAFCGTERIASGSPLHVVLAVKRLADDDENRIIHMFDIDSSEVLEADLRGTVADVAARYADLDRSGGGVDTGESTSPASPRSPGRPKLGVVGREVTLMPRHWDWLASQPGGASVTLRKLVDAARKSGEGAGRARRARDVTFRFISTMAGNEPGYEEAVRALYAGDRGRFETNTSSWSPDVRDHARMIAADAFGE